MWKRKKQKEKNGVRWNWLDRHGTVTCFCLTVRTNLLSLLIFSKNFYKKREKKNFSPSLETKLAARSSPFWLGGMRAETRKSFVNKSVFVHCIIYIFLVTFHIFTAYVSHTILYLT
jgi:hypothetical protein